jgi:hypothetical protein
MRGIRPLGATSFEPAARFAGGQERIQEPLGGGMREQPLAKIAHSIGFRGNASSRSPDP